MKTLIIGFSTPIKPTLFSRMISAFENTTYDHVYVKFAMPEINRDLIYQASKLSVNFESNITFDGHALTVEEYQLTVSDETYASIMQFCLDNSDKPYSISSIIGFVYVKLASLIGKTVHNPFPTYLNSFVCSKLAAEVVEKAGIQLNASPDDIYPLVLHDILVQAKVQRIK